MSNSIKASIQAEFEEKRRRAEMQAYNRKAEIYRKFPTLSEIDKEISNTATSFTRRMINGEDVSSQMSKALSELSEKKNEYLKLCGISPAEFEPKYECEICKDKGFTEEGTCSCFKNRVIEENFKSSNMGESLSYQNFDTFKLDFYSDEKAEGMPLSPRKNMQRNLNRCIAFADGFLNEDKSLLMLGSTGLGKTFLSTCIAGELLKKGFSVIYISAVDFFKRIEKARFDNENSDVILFESCDLLIIDDLGTEAPSVYTTAVFSDILDKRVRLGKKMIFSSNNKLRDFEKLYGERVFSRIAGGFDCLLFYGKDIRIQ
ncbi:MAG: ATP-binding protein, partial [Clostridia bacterium]|nr:ATP-binding protein [Clostridia bacterium]